jgi:hypothetical protein
MLPSPANGPKLEYWIMLDTVAALPTAQAGTFKALEEKSCGTYLSPEMPVRDAVCAP